MSIPQEVPRGKQMAKQAPLTPVVAVLNLKGGVGKTTISAHVFRVFFQDRRAGTLLLDLDPQFNLTQTLFTRLEYEKLKKEGKTIQAVMEPSPTSGLFEIRTSSTPPPTPDEIGKGLWQFPKSTPLQQLMIIPGDFNLIKYSLMDDNRKLTAVRNRFLGFVAKARAQFKVICIDCNPSSSFLTTCALHACTHIVVPVRPDRYSILGLEMLADFVDFIPSINPKPEIIVVLNGTPKSRYDRRIEDELRAHPVFGSQTLVHPIHHSNMLMANPNYTGFATDKRGPYRAVLRNQISKVVDELASKLGI